MAVDKALVRRLAQEDLAANQLFMKTAKDDLARAFSSAPTEALQHHRAAVRAELRAVLANPFAIRVDVSENAAILNMYFTKARHGLIGVMPQLMSWTAPLAQLRHYGIGELAALKVPTGTRKFEVAVKGTYGRTGSRIRDVVYEVRDAKMRVPDLGELLGDLDATEEKVEIPQQALEQQSKPAMGLHEIIFQTDRTQDDVLRFPMRGHLLIEGAPGSGKTTVALQRIPYLIDQQFDELGLKLEAPFFTEDGTIIFVVAEVLKTYLKDLLADLRIAQVEITTVRSFLRTEIRKRKLNEGFRDEPRESDDLVLLKSRAGVLRHLREHCSKALALWLSHVAWMIGVRADRFQGSAEGLPVDVRVELQRQLARVAERCRGGALAVWAPLEGLWEDAGTWRGTLPPGREEGFKVLLGELEELVASACSPASLLRSFVESDALVAWAAEAKAECTWTGVEFNAEKAVEAWRQSIRAKRIGHHDFPLLAWLLTWLTDGQLDRKRVRGLWEPWRKYSHTVIDEGQDCTAVELAFILTLADPRFRCATVVGDLAQRINWPAGLDSWDVPGFSVRDEDGHIGLFRVNYRQTQELGTYAFRFHENAFRKKPLFDPSPKKRGPWPDVSCVGEAELVERIGTCVKRMLKEIPGGSIAVLVESSVRVTRLHEALALELAGRADCEASEGADLTRREVVHVAATDQVKGLEFDCVVVVDAPGDSELAGASGTVRLNKLYVGITRACERLAIVHTERGHRWESITTT